MASDMAVDNSAISGLSGNISRASRAWSVASVGSAAIPGLRRLEQINVPGTGTGNILPRYANATGGEVFSEFTRQAIENAYAAVTLVARNQYTLGYYTQATLAENYRDIEVRVAHPGLSVTAKHGYYPLPPQRQQ